MGRKPRKIALSRAASGPLHGVLDEIRTPDRRETVRPAPRAPCRCARRGRAGHADRAGTHPQRRFAIRLSLGQRVLLPHGISRARVGAGDRARQEAATYPVLPREEPRTRDLGRLPLRPGPGARGVRLRRGLPDRRTRGAPARADRQPGRAAYDGWRRSPVGRARHRLAERRSREGAHRRHRAGRDSRGARDGERHAPHQGRPGAGDHAPRRGDLRGRARARDARCIARAPRVRSRGRADPRILPKWRARAGLRLDRRLRRQRLRAALPRELGRAAQGRPDADRRGLRARQLCRRHHPHVPHRRALLRPAEGHLRARSRLAGSGHQDGEAGRRLRRLP